MRRSSNEIRVSLDDDDRNWLSSSISSRELNEVNGDDVTDKISFSLLKDMVHCGLGSKKTSSLQLRMSLLAHLAPEIKHDYAFGDPIASPID